MKVQFHDPDEFLAELQRDAEHIDRKIVRVTARRSYRPPFITLSVVATAVVGPVVVTLDHRIGESFGSHDSDLSTRANALIDKIIRALTGLGLDVRAGVFEPTAGE